MAIERAMIQTAGIYGKYEVRKADGTQVDPDAFYFVLRLDTDPYARVAAASYATACEYTNPELAADLLEYLARRRKPGLRGLAHPDVNEADIRRLLVFARSVLRKIADFGLDKLGITWSFANQLEAVVAKNACIKCSGRGWLDWDRPVRVKCDRCNGDGIR